MVRTELARRVRKLLGLDELEQRVAVLEGLALAREREVAALRREVSEVALYGPRPLGGG